MEEPVFFDIIHHLKNPTANSTQTQTKSIKINNQAKFFLTFDFNFILANSNNPNAMNNKIPIRTKSINFQFISEEDSEAIRGINKMINHAITNFIILLLSITYEITSISYGFLVN